MPHKCLESFCHITDIAILRDGWFIQTLLVADQLPI